MRINLLNGVFRAGLLRDTGDYRRGNGLPDRAHHDDRGRNHWTPISTLWGCLRSPVNDCPAPHPVLSASGTVPLHPVTRSPVRCSGHPESAGPVQGHRNTPVWRITPRGIPVFRMTGQEPAEVTSGCCIHQRTDGFDKIHTEPDFSVTEGVVMFHGRRSRIRRTREQDCSRSARLRTPMILFW